MLMIILRAWDISGMKQTKTLPSWCTSWIDGRQIINRQHNEQVSNQQKDARCFFKLGTNELRNQI